MYKAYAKYITDFGSTPEKHKSTKVSIKDLHNNLMMFDKRWESIPRNQLSTHTEKRLINGMNTELNRWQAKVKDV